MFTTFIVAPIYNTFIVILGFMPGGDIGLAIIALTLAVRFLFYPIFTSSIRSQMAMQAVQPELTKINELYKKDAPTRARETAALFAKHRIRPFSLILSTVIQLVVFITLSYVFFQLSPPTIHTELLYSFVHTPGVITTRFLGLMDVTALHNVVLAALAGISQYYAIRLSLDRTHKANTSATAAQLASQQMQKKMMILMLPVMGAVFAYTFPAGIGLYMVVTGVVSIAQELILRKNHCS